MELTFRILGVTGNVFDTILQILLVVAIVYACYKGAQTAYSYGYRVFTEKPVAATVGNDVEVTIPVDFSAKQLGEIFEGKGLSRDSKLLMLQYYCSEYRKNIKPGTYTLNTAMTAEEMFESIAQINIEKEEAAKKEAKADVERITAELNAFPQKERQTLGQVWPQAEAELREAVCRVLVLDYIKAHPLSQQGIILSQGMGEKEYASFGVSDANRALEQLTRDKRIVHLEEGYRCLKDDETAKAVLQAERERKEQERRRAEAAAAERERQKKEDLPLCADILNILVDGEAHSIGEILQEVNKMRKQFKLPDYSFADVQRALGWMKEDKQVAYGRPQYASRNRMGYYMI